MNYFFLTFMTLLLALVGCEKTTTTAGSAVATKTSATESGDLEVSYADGIIDDSLSVNLSDDESNPSTASSALSSFKVALVDSDGNLSGTEELSGEVTYKVTIDAVSDTSSISIVVTSVSTGSQLDTIDSDSITFTTSSDGRSVLEFSSKYINAIFSVVSSSSSSSTLSGTVSIDSGATYGSTSATLTLNSSGASQMYITNTSGCASGGSWETYATSKSWTLGQSSGTATVYAKFKSSGGTESSCASDTIVIDTTGPSTPGSVDDGTTVTTTTSSPTFTWTASTDSGSGVSYYKVAIGTSSGGTDTLAWTSVGNVVTYSTSGITYVDGTTYYLSVKAYDAAGNASSEANGDGWTVSVPAAAVGATDLTVTSSVCTILTDASVKCWGYGTNGRLGYGDTTDRATPESTSIDLGTGRTALDLSSVGNATCAVLDDNSLKCWGKGTYGYLGYGDTTVRSAPEVTTTIDLGGNVAAVDMNDAVTCVILSDASVKCWGTNWAGQLGYGDTTERAVPETATAVDLGSGRTATKISVGAYHVCAVLDDDSLKCWGYNYYGALGDGSTTESHTPIAVSLGTTVSEVSTGLDYSCAIIKSDSSVRCWGKNTVGQLGYGDTTNRSTPESTSIDLGTGRSAKAIASGTDDTCVILDDDTVKCWGNAGSNETGYGDNTQRTAPEATATVDLGTGRTALKIDTSIGLPSYCAVLDDASVKCWGTNSDGASDIWYGTDSLFTP